MDTPEFTLSFLSLTLSAKGWAALMLVPSVVLLFAALAWRISK
jgi:hypothetical protein